MEEATGNLKIEKTYIGDSFGSLLGDSMEIIDFDKDVYVLYSSYV